VGHLGFVKLQGYPISRISFRQFPVEVTIINLSIALKAPARVFTAAKVEYTIAIRVCAPNSCPGSIAQRTREGFPSVHRLDYISPLAFIDFYFRTELRTVVVDENLPGTAFESKKRSFSDSTAYFVAQGALQRNVRVVVTKNCYREGSIILLVVAESEAH